MAVGEPHAHRHRHQGDRQGRDELEHRGRREGEAQGVQAGAAVAVGDPADHRRLGARPAEGDERRQPAHHVEEVSRQGLHRPPLPLGAVPGGQADQDAEDRHQRQGEQHDHGTEQVLAGDREDREGRQHAGQHEGRQVAGEVGLGRRDAPGDQGRRLAGAGSAARVAAQHRLGDPAAQVAADGGGGPGGEHVTQPADRRAEREQGRHAHGPPGHVTGADHRHHQTGDRPGLGDHQHAGDDPRGEHAGQVGPGGRQLPAQARVRRPHRAAVAAGPVGTVGSVGMWWTEIRRRNTQ